MTFGHSKFARQSTDTKCVIWSAIYTFGKTAHTKKRNKNKKCVTLHSLNTDQYLNISRLKEKEWIHGWNIQGHHWLYAVQVGASVRHSLGHGDIVRVFFLLESRRGNGTKLFTSLKHNPVSKRQKQSVFLHMQHVHNSNSKLNRKPLKVNCVGV